MMYFTQADIDQRVCPPMSLCATDTLAVRGHGNALHDPCLIFVLFGDASKDCGLLDRLLGDHIQRISGALGFGCDSLQRISGSLGRGRDTLHTWAKFFRIIC